MWQEGQDKMEFVELTHHLSLPLMREVARRAGGRENMKIWHFYSLPQSASLTAQFIVRLPPAIVCFDSLRDAPPTSEGAFKIGANLFAKLKFSMHNPP